MKIERISENQLKLTLTKDDLEERDIKLEDLITPSEKNTETVPRYYGAGSGRRRFCF